MTVTFEDDPKNDKKEQKIVVTDPLLQQFCLQVYSTLSASHRPGFAATFKGEELDSVTYARSMNKKKEKGGK